METETTTWSEFPNGGNAIVEQTLASRKNKCTSDNQWFSQSLSWTVKSPNTSRLIDQENLIYVDDIESKTMHKDKEGDW